MVYAYTQDVPIDEQVYARILKEIGEQPMDGLLLHLCVRRPEGGLRYLDIWDSEEQWARAFAERVRPAVYAVFNGSPPAAEPPVDRLDIVDLRGSLLPA